MSENVAFLQLPVRLIKLPTTPRGDHLSGIDGLALENHNKLKWPPVLRFFCALCSKKALALTLIKVTITLLMLNTC